MHPDPGSPGWTGPLPRWRPGSAAIPKAAPTAASSGSWKAGASIVTGRQPVDWNVRDGDRRQIEQVSEVV
jgi:hypothetical protein